MRKEYLFVFIMTINFFNNKLIANSSFTLVDNKVQAIIILPETEPECVRLAVADFIQDVYYITGKTLKVINKPILTKQPQIIIGTMDRSDKTLQLFTNRSTFLHGQWEAYQVQSVNNNLIIAGSNERGTMFGIYHFIEEYLAVDPMYFWSDKMPEKRQVLQWQNVDLQQDKPTFEYRGWFINDEDLLTEWYESVGKRNIDYPFYGQVVSPEILKKVYETMLRLRFNLVIPASFIDIRNPAEAILVKEAVKRGLFISMHHVEPMGVSAFTFFNYWKAKGKKPLFSFYSNRKELEEVWRVYAQEWSKYPNVVWQVGLRGIADRPMWLADPGVPQSDADRGKLISEAMQVQMNIITEVDQRSNPPVTTTLWAEGSVLNNAGHLQVPQNVTVVFADNSPGWRWQEDFFQTQRNLNYNYGIYYHHQLWSSGPHLVQIVPPLQTYKVLKQAVEKGDTTYCIMNVSNVREFNLGIQASAQMLHNFQSFNVQSFNQDWFVKYYENSAKEVEKVYAAYFNSFVMNDKTGTPILMDGQTNNLATNLLRELKLQLSDQKQYQDLLKKKNEETEEKKWGRAALADMGSGNLSQQELLARVIQQKQSFLQADSLAGQVYKTLTTTQKDFFQQNIHSHLKIMIGLETWLENMIQAKLAADMENRSDVKRYLQNAIEAFTLIKKGQSFNTQSNKWQYWYRGDKKMNLPDKEKLTKEVLEIALHY